MLSSTDSFIFKFISFNFSVNSLEFESLNLSISTWNSWYFSVKELNEELQYSAIPLSLFILSSICRYCFFTSSILLFDSDFNSEILVDKSFSFSLIISISSSFNFSKFNRVKECSMFLFLSLSLFSSKSIISS